MIQTTNKLLKWWLLIAIKKKKGRETVIICLQPFWETRVSLEANLALEH